MMPPVQPETIMRHVYGLFPGLALLSDIRLDIFSLLEDRSIDAGETLGRIMGFSPAEKILDAAGGFWENEKTDCRSRIVG